MRPEVTVPVRRPPRPTGHRRAARGLAMVELAITLPVLLTLLAGATELARAMQQYETVVKSARAAARYMSQFAPGTTGAQAQATNLVIYGNLAGSGTPLAPGLANATISYNERAQTFTSTGGTVLGTLRLVDVRVDGMAYTPLFSTAIGTIDFPRIAATSIQAD